MASVSLTDEQRSAAECDAQNVTVMAGAGTGKTKTCEEYCLRRLERNPRESGVLFVYNSSAQRGIQERFRKHPRAELLSRVEVRTSHSVPFRKIGYKYADQLISDLRAPEVKAVLPGESLSSVPADRLLAYCNAVAVCLKKWLCSASLEMDAEWVLEAMSPRERMFFAPAQVLQDAEFIWKKMCDSKDTSIGMLHDGYLKMFQVQDIRLQYDFIVNDEAQDQAPVFTSLVTSEKQKDAIKFWVGDENQALYQWRGAQNALGSVPSDERFYLTNSWRFGTSVEFYANEVLAYKESVLRLNGRGRNVTEREALLARSYTFVAATNAGVFEHAAGLAEGKKVFFIGGIESYRLGKMIALERLARGQRVESAYDPYLSLFSSFEEVEEFSTSVEDVETLSCVRVVKRYGRKIPELIERLRNSVVKEERKADVVLSTGHKIKGLEAPVVRLAEDFVSAFDEDGKIKPYDPDECERWNNLYVALTRGKAYIYPPQSLLDFIAVKRRERELLRGAA